MPPEKVCDRSEEKKAAAVVVTIRALTPQEERVRLRDDFPGMISHELRTLPSPIKRA